MNIPSLPYEPDESHAEALFRPPGDGAAPPPPVYYDPPCGIPALAALEQKTNDDPTVTSERVVMEDPS